MITLFVKLTGQDEWISIRCLSFSLIPQPNYTTKVSKLTYKVQTTDQWDFTKVVVGSTTRMCIVDKIYADGILLFDVENNYAK